MENLVGDVLPSETDANQLLDDVKAIAKKIEQYGDNLTPDERAHAPKPPDGSEPITELVASLVTKHKVSLPGVGADDLLADLTLAKRLAPLVSAIAALERQVQDVILQANAERWAATTAGYTALVRAMSASSQLENDLKPALEFFGVGRKRKRRSPKPT